MRDRIMGLLLSVMLSGFSFGDVVNDDFSRPTADTLSSTPVATLDVDAADTVMDENGVEVKRLHPVTVSNLNEYPAQVREPAFDVRPLIWTLHHHDRTPLLAAGLWPISAESARLALNAESDRQPTAEDVATLLRVVLNHCHDRGYLKLHLHAPNAFAPEPALLENLGFLHSRSHERRGTTVSTCYRNLYHSPFNDRGDDRVNLAVSRTDAAARHHSA